MAVAAGLVACGGGGNAHPSRKPVPFAVFKQVPLDATRGRVERQFGTPVRIAPAGKLDPGATCLFYPAPRDARPATEYEFCFIAGRLHSKFAG